jgi:hypothetical protein
MSYTSNRTLLEKADLALADLTAGGGILLPAQAQKFMRLLIKQSVLMQLATVVPMASPKHQLSKIKFGSRILRPGQEATALAVADRARPTSASWNSMPGCSRPRCTSPTRCSRTTSSAANCGRPSSR